MNKLKNVVFLLLFWMSRTSANDRDQCFAEENLSYGFCPGAERPVYLTCFFIQPYPVILEANETLSLIATMRLTKTIPVNSSVNLKITKVDGTTEVAIPCLDTPQWGPIGSCKYEGNQFLRFFHEFFCPDVQQQDCSLPLEFVPDNTNANNYGRKDPYNFTLPDFPSDFNFMISGVFNIELTVMDENGTDLTCVEFVVETGLHQTAVSIDPPTTSGPDTCSECFSKTGKNTLQNHQNMYYPSKTSKD